METKDHTRLPVAELLWPNIWLRLFGFSGDVPAGKPVEYALSCLSLSHSCPVVIVCVIAFVSAV